MSFEEQHQAVLMNIELPIVVVYRQHPELLDLHVDEALGTLVSRYRAEEQGKEVFALRGKGLALMVCEAVMVNTELMLGRLQPVMDSPDSGAGHSIADLEVILACLSRVRKSVKFWSKERGSRGYLNFVGEMMPG